MQQIGVEKMVVLTAQSYFVCMCVDKFLFPLKKQHGILFLLFPLKKVHAALLVMSVSHMVT